MKDTPQKPKHRKAMNAAASVAIALDKASIGRLKGIGQVLSKADITASVSVLVRRALDVYADYVASIRDNETKLEREALKVSRAAKGRSSGDIEAAARLVTGEKLPPQTLNLAPEGSREDN